MMIIDGKKEAEILRQENKVNDALKPSVVITPDEKPLVVYYLRASVWGRAFLTQKGNPNKTITVKVNDEL